MQQTLGLKRKPISKKFISSLIRDYNNFDELKDDDLDNNKCDEEDMSNNMISKQKLFKKVLFKKHIQNEDAGKTNPETKFHKPNKSQKREKRTFVVSEEQKAVENLILTGNIDESIPVVKMEDGSTQIADCYLWTKSTLSSKLKNDLHDMCNKYKLKLSGTKKEFIERLLDYRSELMKSFVTNSIKELKNTNEESISKNIKKNESEVLFEDPPLDMWNEDMLQNLTVSNLQHLCKKFHLKKVKTKKTIIAHLLEYKKKSSIEIKQKLNKKKRLLEKECKFFGNKRIKSLQEQ